MLSSPIIACFAGGGGGEGGDSNHKHASWGRFSSSCFLCLQHFMPAILKLHGFGVLTVVILTFYIFNSKGIREGKCITVIHAEIIPCFSDRKDTPDWL